MAENNKRRRVRSESMALDAMHIIIGIAVVAAVLNLATGKYWLSRTKRERRRRTAAVFQMGFGTVLLIFTILSAVSIW